MWGQGQHYTCIFDFSGIIPTRVGTSIRVKICCAVTRDHPHACGDKVFTSPLCVSLRGSSPRVWGQELLPITTQFSPRIIPTRVGTRWYTAKQRAAERDHPHACGDKTQTDYISMTELGSSPRVWGQVNFGEVIEDIFRIIPTRVGTRI